MTPVSDRTGAYCHRRIHANHIAFFDQQLARLKAELSHLGFGYGFACAQL
jgi:hypothetical protein